MNCALCKTELTQPDSIKYHLCFECRHFPQPGVKAQTEQQHNEAVRQVRRLIKSFTVQSEAQK